MKFAEFRVGQTIELGLASLDTENILAFARAWVRNGSTPIRSAR